MMIPSHLLAAFLCVVVLLCSNSDGHTNMYTNSSLPVFGVWQSLTRFSGHPSCSVNHARLRRSTNHGAAKNEDSVTPLKCPPCEQLHCFRKQKRRRLQCSGGMTLDICDCCRVCAKLEGELCGGQHNYLGKCDRGLFCEAQSPQIIHVDRGGVKKTYTVTRGICKKVPEKPIYERDFQNGSSGVCRPDCDHRFCKKNPRAICSARQNAESHRKCQEPCQHTSCRACRFVQPQQLCPKCSIDDFKCLRDFGRCMKRNTCQKKLYEYPCRTTQKIREPKGQFLCRVPDCITMS